MARKKRTAIKGTDPAYTSDFSQPLPTHKIAEKTEQAPATVAKPTQPPTTSQPEQTVKPEPAAKPTPKPEIRAAHKFEQENPSDKREIAMSAAVKFDQNEKLTALEKKGISAKDAITLAGRRAVEQFEPKAVFVEKPRRGPNADAPRL